LLTAPNGGSSKAERDMAGSTYTWIGVSGTAFAGNDPAEWSLAGVSPSGPPNQGDSAIVNQGTILLLDAGLHTNTIT
jgi:hypothetical protein